MATRTTTLNVQAQTAQFNSALSGANNGLQTFVRGIYGASGSVGLFGANMFQARAALSSFTTAAGAAGLAAGGIVALGAALAQATRTAAVFEDQMITMRNNTNMTDDEFKAVRQSVLGLSVTTGAATQQIADAYRIASNEGLNFATSQKVVREATQAAVATGAQVNDVTQALTVTMRQFNIPASDSAKTLETLYVASRNANMTLQEFVSTGARLYSTVAAMGLSFNDFAAAESALSRQGFPASQAVSGLTTALSHMVEPTSAEHKELQLLDSEFGSHLVQDFSQASLQANGLGYALNDLQAVVGNNTSEVLKLIPAIRGGREIMALITNASGDFNSNLKDLNSTTNEATNLTDAYNRKAGDGKVALDRLGAATHNTAVEIGDVLVPSLSLAADFMDHVTLATYNAIAALRSFPGAMQGAKSWQQFQQEQLGIQEGGSSAGGQGYWDPQGVYHPPGTSGVASTGGQGYWDPQGVYHPPGEVQATTTPGRVATPPGRGLSQSPGYGPPTPTAEQTQQQLDYNASQGAAALRAKYAGDSLDTLKAKNKELTSTLDDQRSKLDLLTAARDKYNLAGDIYQAQQADVDIKKLNDDIKANEGDQREVNSLIALDEAGRIGATNATKAQTAALQEQRDALSDLKTAMQAAKQAQQDLTAAQITGTQQYKDREEKIQEQVNRQQLQIANWELAHKAGATVPLPMENQLKRLQLQLAQVKDQEAVTLGPQQYQVARTQAAIAHPEMAASDILAGIAAAQSAIDALGPLISKTDSTTKSLRDSIAAIKAGKVGVSNQPVAAADLASSGALASLVALLAIIGPLSGKGGPLSIPSYDIGGEVNGPKGSPILAMIHGGETVVKDLPAFLKEYAETAKTANESDQVKTAMFLMEQGSLASSIPDSEGGALEKGLDWGGDLFKKIWAKHEGSTPEFGLGGVVPGPLGWPKLIKAHGGETVSQAAASSRGSGGISFQGPLVTIDQVTLGGGSSQNIDTFAKDLGDVILGSLDQAMSQDSRWPIGTRVNTHGG